jgi:hypothetical protein
MKPFQKSFSKTLFLFSLVIILISGSAFAADFNYEVGKENYTSKEGAWVRLNFEVDLTEDLTASKISLYDNGTLVSITKSLFKLDDYNYYFSFVVPSVTAGEYTIEIEDIRFVKDNVLNFVSFDVPFNIGDGQETISLWPPIWIDEYDQVNVPQKNIEITNYEAETASINVYDEGTLISMISPSSFKLNNGNLAWVSLRTVVADPSLPFHETYVIFESGNNSYELPIILKKKFYTGPYLGDMGGEVEEIEITEINQTFNETLVVVEPINASQGASLVITYPFEDELARVVVSDEPLELTVMFRNDGDSDLNGLRFELTGGLEEVLSLGELPSSLEVGGSDATTITIVPNQSTVDRYLGDVVIGTNSGVSDKLSFDLRFETDEVVEEEYGFEDPSDAPADEVFNNAMDSASEANYTGWIVIIAVILVLLGVALTLYLKGRKKQDGFEKFVDKINKRK